MEPRIHKCDPLWEKVPLGGKYIIEIWAEIAKNMMVLPNLVFVTGEGYGLASTVSRWSGVQICPNQQED